MTTKIQKWGNSLAVRLPKAITKDLNLREGTSVSFSTEGSSVLITHSKKNSYTLKQLVGGITKKNKHGAADWGKTVGKEMW